MIVHIIPQHLSKPMQNGKQNHFLATGNKNMQVFSFRKIVARRKVKAV